MVPVLAQLLYETRLQQLNLHSLYCHREKGDLIEVYKMINQLNQVSPDPFFVNSTTRGYNQKTI